MKNIDLKSEFKILYKPSAKEVVAVNVPAFGFLMIDGEGNPNNSQQYVEAVQALFSVAYSIKFALKNDLGLNYTVMPLEGQWWADDLSTFVKGDKTQWKWTMMIMQPPETTKTIVQAAVDLIREKKGFAGLAKIRYERLKEGRCAQTMHIGPFSTEGLTIARIHSFIQDNSKLRGKHHEIYLSDIRRAAPERWRTIIRQPME